MQAELHGFRFEPYIEPEFLEFAELDTPTQLVAYELAFEDEQSGLTHRFACDEYGNALVPTRDFVRAVDNFRFVGMFSRTGKW